MLQDVQDDELRDVVDDGEDDAWACLVALLPAPSPAAPLLPVAWLLVACGGYKGSAWAPAWEARWWQRWEWEVPLAAAAFVVVAFVAMTAVGAATAAVA
mmetsp:Transcript_26695/g.49081  ORF Transcript_26695/g.49081 Transcript_26695/m.49081 type:complete len:99 (+) Transcript_26695:358-654(+)